MALFDFFRRQRPISDTRELADFIDQEFGLPGAEGDL